LAVEGNTGRIRAGVAACVALAALALMGLIAPATRAAGVVSSPDFSEARVAGGLNLPSAIAFLPNRDILVTEKGTSNTGALKRISGGTVTTLATLSTCTSSEMGVLGVAVDPSFATNGTVYIYITKPGAGGCGTATGRFNRIEKLTISGSTATGETVLPQSTDIRTDGGNHNAGTLRIGPDGKLYVSVGDTGVGDSGVPGNSTNPYAQSLASLNGKILRLNLDGSAAAGNPFTATAGARPEIWAYGFRNPFRMSFDPQTGKLWAGDVGQDTVEELDIVQAGGNYAWPHCEGTLPTGCEQAGDIDPVYTSPHSGTGATGGCIIAGGFTGASYGLLANQYIFGDCNSNKIFRAPLNATRTGFATAPVEFVTSAATPSDFQFGPDGDLYYVAESGGEVRRVTPNYPRPKGASPTYVSLVPAFQPCAVPNRTHAAPLAFGSCNPPAQTSGNLTVGTPDANGAAANSTGFVKLAVTATDVKIDASLRDVRCKGGVSTCASANAQDGPDYTGQLQLRIPLRITDKDNAPGSAGGSGAATTQDNFITVTVPCAATADTAAGGDCAVTTTANTLTPSSVKSGMRTVWALDQLQVNDGGTDGVASTGPNSLFAVQGVFAP
jgi:glucose/arabinose dehydrogenase